jgi:hypothetical protein
MEIMYLMIGLIGIPPPSFGSIFSATWYLEKRSSVISAA